jgi:GH3 auxin-responsive promoter
MTVMREPLLKALQIDRARRSAIEKAFEMDPIDTRQIWPRLDTLSTWADATSRPYARRLQKLFPHTMLQPKGLLATEGAITLPFGHHWPIPALASSFLEFVDDDGRVQLCDELREGANYRVVLTNSNGLYRYDLGDLVHCRGYAEGLPLLEFVGRGNVCSDLVGEKLDERFAVAALAEIEQPACLLPRAATQPFYELLVEIADRRAADPLAAMVERRLCDNPQYAYARAVGQLGPVSARVVKNLVDRHAHAEMRRGRRLADIKPPTLLPAVGNGGDARIS